MEIKEKLEQDLASAPWGELKPHYDRGALIIEAPEQSLVSVGVAFHDDQKDQVETWLADGTISKCSETQAKSFAEAEEEPSFEYLILQPFVLVKLIRKHFH